MSVTDLFFAVLAATVVSWMAIIGAKRENGLPGNEGQTLPEGALNSLDSKQGTSKNAVNEDEADGVNDKEKSQWDPVTGGFEGLQPDSSRSQKDRSLSMIVDPTALAVAAPPASGPTEFSSLVMTQVHQPASNEASSEKNPAATTKQPVTQATVQPQAAAQAPSQDAVTCREGHHPDAEGDCNAQCPDNTVSKKPDAKGNCQCKPDFECFDSRILDDEKEMSKELKPENQKTIMKAVESDQEGKRAGCSMRAHELKKGEDADSASTSPSEVFFQHSCEHCKCRATGGSQALEVHVVAFFLLFSAMSL